MTIPSALGKEVLNSAGSLDQKEMAEELDAAYNVLRMPWGSSCALFDYLTFETDRPAFSTQL